MTGAYLRVKRNGKWQNIEVEYLTDEEREEALKDDPRLIKWLNLVCKCLMVGGRGEVQEYYKREGCHMNKGELI